jgi:hypothetical protein
MLPGQGGLRLCPKVGLVVGFLLGKLDLNHEARPVRQTR